jgi:tetratricopeptide (TPR) repeat protein
VSRLIELEDVATKMHEVLFARHIRVQRLEIAAWVADLENKTDSSVLLMTQAAELEASTPKHAVTPAATLPAYELLGDLLLKRGKASDAKKAYERSMEMNPLRFNSLLGAARASKAMNRLDSAVIFYRQLTDVTNAVSKREAIQEAQKFLAK